MPLVNDLMLLLAEVAARAPNEEEDAAAWEAQAREDETPEETIRTVAVELMAEVASALCESSSHDHSGHAVPAGPAASRGEQFMFLILPCLQQAMTLGLSACQPQAGRSILLF